MIGQIARRAATPAARRVTVARRTLMDSTPNTVGEQQKAFQKGATPYLRGEADPTYLRKSSDGPIVGTMVAVACTAWLFIGYNHFRMWNDKK